MFRKMILIFCVIIVALTLFTTPVSAKRGVDGRSPRSHGWDIDITVYDPYVFDPVYYPDQYLWSFSFTITMPPVSWPINVVVAREGVLMPDYEFTIYYEDTGLGFAGPVWEINPPESITYTFILTAKGKTITEDVTVNFD
jgi:hypothetical protein